MKTALPIAGADSVWHDELLDRVYWAVVEIPPREICLERLHLLRSILERSSASDYSPCIEAVFRDLRRELRGFKTEVDDALFEVEVALAQLEKGERH